MLQSLNLTDKPILAHLSSLPVLLSTPVNCKLQRVRPCLPLESQTVYSFEFCSVTFLFNPFRYQAFWYPHLIPRGDGGGGVGRPSLLSISKTASPMNLKFCRVLETSFHVLEILKLLKFVQSALSDLKRLPERLQSQCNYRPFIT